ncbi:porin [Hydrogenimonas sp.]|uniref:OprO/OprP family phosphate-selective porin n=1 Tax=Hydrogenimonas sp. TaxID=2231112 RepID=UPI002623E930|nr:porin [Hydrogenimonas sp.]
MKLFRESRRMMRPILAVSLFCGVVTGLSGSEIYRYPPMISNEMNASAYDWNALNTKWVNMRALAMLAVDAAHFYQDDKSRDHVGDMSHYDRFDIRGLRLGFGGTINFETPWVYLVTGSINSVQQDYDSSTTDPFTLLDCELGIPMWGKYGRMQIGKMKEPISMERSMGLVFEQVMERPMHLDALLPSRNIGITFSDLVWNERIHWRAGYFNDWLDEDDLDYEESNRQYIGRITTVAYADPDKERLLHLGASYRYEDIQEGKIRYDVGPEFYFSTSWLDTGEFAAKSSNTVNLELSYLDGPLWLASEYTVTAVDSSTHGDPTFWGYHVAINYFVTGEHRGYNYRRGVVRRITPSLNFNEGGWGALELSARYSYFDLDDGDIEGGKMDIASFGFVWHPRKAHQFHVQWSHAHCDGGGGEGVDPTMSSRTDILQFRWVLVID